MVWGTRPPAQSQPRRPRWGLASEGDFAGALSNWNDVPEGGYGGPGDEGGVGGS